MPRQSPNEEENIKRKKLVPPGSPMSMVSVTMTIEQAEIIFAQAAERKVPVGWVITELIEAGLEFERLANG